LITEKGGRAPTASIGGHSRGFILFMLTLVYVVNYLDRTILAIVLPEIKHDFRLSDAALGFLSGTSFAITYATLGMPLAWIADRANRRNVIAASVALFSAMTVFCAYAANALQLVIARVFTGVGEAGTGPSIQSVISDLYPPKQRGAALSIYSSGTNIGLLLAFFGGGQIAQHFGWRTAFLVSGLPGLLLFVFLLGAVPEPPRGHIERIKDDKRAPTFFATVAFLWSQRSFRWIAIGTALSAFVGYAVITFVPLFLSVSHGMGPSERGLSLALLSGFGGGFGTFISGVLADALSQRNVRWNMYLPVVFVVITIPCMPLFYLSPSLRVTLLCAIIPMATSAAYLAPCMAMTQGLVPLRMRAQAAAILFFVLNIIGCGLGPLCIGKLSDILHPALGSDSIRWAMLATTIPLLVSAGCYWKASRTLKTDLSRGAGVASAIVSAQTAAQG
jgi:predicted MFS family arabinose efflux permease